ncbi:hypothetical protein ACOME3_009240 [Neoechinorhynchus agilis]
MKVSSHLFTGLSQYLIAIHSHQSKFYTRKTTTLNNLEQGVEGSSRRGAKYERRISKKTFGATKPVTGGNSDSTAAYEHNKSIVEFTINENNTVQVFREIGDATKLEQHFELNDVVDETMKKKCLLSWLSASFFDRLSMSIGFQKPTDMDYEPLIKALDHLYGERAHEIPTRNRFHAAALKPG